MEWTDFCLEGQTNKKKKLRIVDALTKTWNINEERYCLSQHENIFVLYSSCFSGMLASQTTAFAMEFRYVPDYIGFRKWQMLQQNDIIK
jgi:hypothetical protein